MCWKLLIACTRFILSFLFINRSLILLGVIDMMNLKSPLSSIPCKWKTMLRCRGKWDVSRRVGQVRQPGKFFKREIDSYEMYPFLLTCSNYWLKVMRYLRYRSHFATRRPWEKVINRDPDCDTIDALKQCLTTTKLQHLDFS